MLAGVETGEERLCTNVSSIRVTFTLLLKVLSFMNRGNVYFYSIIKDARTIQPSVRETFIKKPTLLIIPFNLLIKRPLIGFWQKLAFEPHHAPTVAIMWIMFSKLSRSVRRMRIYVLTVQSMTARMPKQV